MINLQGKTKVDLSGLKRFERRLKTLCESQVEMGFYDTPHYSGLTSAQLMTIHEFGYNNLPQRNAMLSSSLSFKYDLPKYTKQVYNAVVTKGQSPEVAMKIIGEKYKQTLVFVIDAGLFSNPKVSKEWAKVKGSSDALVHYGDLKDSAQYKITASGYSPMFKGRL
jgi:hypothetical protein